MPTATYHQPFCRYLTIVRFIFFADLVASSALWLAGGDSQYLEDNVTKFQMNQSVFDLAMIRFLLALSFIALYTELERLSIQCATRDEDNDKLKQKKLFYTFLAFILTTANLAYSITKCVFIIQEHNKHPKVIHSTYYALAITSVGFSGVEFLLFFSTIMVLKKTAIRYSKMTEDELANGGKKDEKKKADLGRLFSLVKPVSHFLYQLNFMVLYVLFVIPHYIRVKVSPIYDLYIGECLLERTFVLGHLHLR